MAQLNTLEPEFLSEQSKDVRLLVYHSGHLWPVLTKIIVK